MLSISNMQYTRTDEELLAMMVLFCHSWAMQDVSPHASQRKMFAYQEQNLVSNNTINNSVK